MPKHQTAQARVSCPQNDYGSNGDAVGLRANPAPGGGRRVHGNGAEQVLARTNQSPPDRLMDFARAARQSLNGALFRCEERYPKDGLHSVLYVVVERDAANFREKLNSLQQEFFSAEDSDPLAPVRLEVIDRSTDEALTRLMQLGLVSKTIRASRSLYPSETAATQTVELSHWERLKAASQREVAARKLKIAALLGGGGLHEEARTALLEAVLPLGSALATESRLPEPASIQEALLAPLAQHWGEALRPLRQLVNDSQTPWEPVLEQMLKL